MTVAQAARMSKLRVVVLSILLSACGGPDVSSVAPSAASSALQSVPGILPPPYKFPMPCDYRTTWRCMLDAADQYDADEARCLAISGKTAADQIRKALCLDRARESFAANMANCNECGANKQCTAEDFCCGTGEAGCHGKCVPQAIFKDSPYDCGHCGRVCGNNEYCCDGWCVADKTGGKCSACPKGQSSCSGATPGSNYCADMQTDPKNCGACGKTCASGQECCGGTCTAKQDDPRNCGACGNACGSEQVCDHGACRTCAIGDIPVDNKCVGCGCAKSPLQRCCTEINPSGIRESWCVPAGEKC
jgi:hypothetical protein